MTAVNSLLATSVHTWRKSIWFPQPCVNFGYFTKAPRPATGLTSLRVGSANPSEVHFFMPVLPVSQLSSVQAAALFLESFAIEYEFVKARFPRVLPFGIGASERSCAQVFGTGWPPIRAGFTSMASDDQSFGYP